MQKVIKGFSLIELMIVIAIIGILASIGIPAYGDYLIRSRVTELVSSAEPAKKAIGEFGVVNSGFTNATSFAAVGIEDPSNASPMIANTTLSDPTATSVYFQVCGKESALGITGAGNYLGIIFKATYANGGVQWQCQYQANPATYSKYVPSTCRTVTDATTKTACTTVQ